MREGFGKKKGLLRLMDYTLTRSNRKTLAIFVKKDATLHVRAPLLLPVSKIDAFVCEKESWILKKQRQMRSLSQKAAGELSECRELLLFGRRYPVETADAFAFDGERFLIPAASDEEARLLLLEFYRTRLLQPLQKRVAYYSEHMGLVPSSVGVSRANRQWGSCTGKNRLYFSWMLALADQFALDYVVVHELAHMRERNHSAKFWLLVESVLPDYRERKKALLLLGRQMAQMGLERC